MSDYESKWIGQLAGYSPASEKLRFAVNWLIAHRNPHSEWDLGASAKDSVYLPLSNKKE
jgi:hypothetical protein